MNKEELRSMSKYQRDALSDEHIDMFSSMISERLFSEFDISGKTVSIFLPIERFREINTWKIIDNSPNTKFILPVVKGDDLVHIRYESKDQLEISDWGIPEPRDGEEVNVQDLDLVLVPLLAFDSLGNRVGYGKGFYDGFLSKCNPNCLFVGLSYFDPVDEISDVFEGDIRLHKCITPSNVYSF